MKYFLLKKKKSQSTGSIVLEMDAFHHKEKKSKVKWIRNSDLIEQ